MITAVVVLQIAVLTLLTIVWKRLPEKNPTDVKDYFLKLKGELKMAENNIVVELRNAINEAVDRVNTRTDALEAAAKAYKDELDALKALHENYVVSEDAEDVEQNAALADQQAKADAAAAELAATVEGVRAELGKLEAVGNVEVPVEPETPAEPEVPAEPEAPVEEVPGPGEVVPDGEIAPDAAAPADEPAPADDDNVQGPAGPIPFV